MPTIAIYVTWKGLGFYILLYLAALQNVQKELYEAAAVDGAGRWRSFRSVTWPGVRPATTLVLVLAIITGANLFTEPYLLTGGGGPNGASSSPVLIMYQRGIQQGNAGEAAAIGVILVIFVGDRRAHRPLPQRTERVMSTTDETIATNSDQVAAPRQRRIGRLLLLTVGAFVFIFPFWYMFIGSLQEESDSGIGGAVPRPGNLTTANYSDINEAIDLVGSLANSAIVTIGVLLGTIFFGLLAGYAMAVLHYRGRGATFASVLLVQTIPFQLLMIPLYVLLVRDYGLGDTYLGMILPFAISPAAVFIFRQFFLQLPRELFDAARIDGASEFTILRRIAVPLARPAILTATLLTFIGPWNEFLWPFLITKQADMQPLAVSLANYISTLQATVANPFGSVMAGACVLAAPVVGLFIVFQRHFTSSDIGSGVKG